MPPAAYRDVGGAWLSGCSETPANLRRVACVEQNRLLAALQDGLTPDDEELPADMGRLSGPQSLRMANFDKARGARELDISWGKRVVAVSGVSAAAESEGSVAGQAMEQGEGASWSREGPVVLRFEDGTSAQGDLLVGADGADSLVRKTMFPDAVSEKPWTPKPKA